MTNDVGSTLIQLHVSIDTCPLSISSGYESWIAIIFWTGYCCLFYRFIMVTFLGTLKFIPYKDSEMSTLI